MDVKITDKMATVGWIAVLGVGAFIFWGTISLGAAPRRG